MIAIDLSKKAIQKQYGKFNFTASLDPGGQTTMFFILEEAKETVLDFSQGTVRVLQFYFVLI